MTKPYQPWQPITDTKDLKCLGKLGEESGELSQVICRIIIQGIDQCNPDTGISNRLWLEKEIADVLANIQLVMERFDLNEQFISDQGVEKYSKIKNWQDNM
jgi:hypothetical protein